MLRLVVLGGIGVSLSGCATTFYDSASATGGKRFVVGSYNNNAAVWLCPEEAGKAECERVEIEFKD